MALRKYFFASQGPSYHRSPAAVEVCLGVCCPLSLQPPTGGFTVRVWGFGGFGVLGFGFRVLGLGFKVGF